MTIELPYEIYSYGYDTDPAKVVSAKAEVELARAQGRYNPDRTGYIAAIAGIILLILIIFLFTTPRKVN